MEGLGNFFSDLVPLYLCFMSCMDDYKVKIGASVQWRSLTSALLQTSTDSAVRLPAELLAKCSRAEGALTHCQDLLRVMSRRAKRAQKLWRSVFTSKAGNRSYR